MIEIYKTNEKTGKVESVNEITKNTWINLVSPTKEEIEKISESLNITDELIKYPLDIAEKPHIDEEDDSILIVVDVPLIEKKDDNNMYITIPLGFIIVRDEYVITVSQKSHRFLNQMINMSRTCNIDTNQKSRLIFQTLYRISSEYIRYIGYISRDLEKFEEKMANVMKNKELMPLLDFEKSMIYFNTAIKANHTVLTKLNRGKLLKIREEDEELLEDIIIENRQAIEMISTYSEILNGIIDIFSTIVSNNLNQVMKFLTAITLLIAIPTLVTSFMGMNLVFPFRVDDIGFYGVASITVIVTVITAIWLKRRDMF